MPRSPPGPIYFYGDFQSSTPFASASSMSRSLSSSRRKPSFIILLAAWATSRTYPNGFQLPLSDRRTRIASCQALDLGVGEREELPVLSARIREARTFV